MTGVVQRMLVVVLNVRQMRFEFLETKDIRPM
jgi:hypothetical protein